MERAFVANDGLVHAALVALALVVGLRNTKVEMLEQLFSWIRVRLISFNVEQRNVILKD